MSNPVPNSLALTTIADGSPRVAAPVRNNFSSVQSEFNKLVTLLSGGVVGQVLQAADSSHVQWASPLVRYTKVTAKAVNTSVADTDLLNGEFSLAAGVMGATGTARLTATGDFVNNTGSSQKLPQFKIKLGSGPTVVIDTSTPTAVTAGTSATRYPWMLDCLIRNLTATTQTVEFTLKIASTSGTAGNVTFATGSGEYTALYGPGTFQWSQALGVNLAPTGVDTANSTAVVFSVVNGVSSANYETKLIAAELLVNAS